MQNIAEGMVCFFLVLSQDADSGKRGFHHPGTTVIIEFHHIEDSGRQITICKQIHKF